MVQANYAGRSEVHKVVKKNAALKEEVRSSERDLLMAIRAAQRRHGASKRRLERAEKKLIKAKESPDSEKGGVDIDISSSQNISETGTTTGTDSGNTSDNSE